MYSLRILRTFYSSGTFEEFRLKLESEKNSSNVLFLKERSRILRNSDLKLEAVKNSSNVLFLKERSRILRNSDLKLEAEKNSSNVLEA